MREIGVGESDAAAEQIGPYQTVMLLGHGGTGRVFRARHPLNGSTVAVKLLHRSAEDNPEAAAQFLSHCQTLQAIQHPNVACILDQGLSAEGTPYQVMEFVDGPSVADLIQNRVPLQYSKIARMMVDASLGLQAAFKHRIIHRDIKPANLMLGLDGVLKIVDFGLARNVFDPNSRPAPGAVVGTPRYMAPEQAVGQSVDHRSDMYSLGASFYHLITGQPPFEADTSRALLLKHLQEPLVPLYVINPEVPGDLADVVQRLMAKDPSDRFEDYDELIAQLREVEMARIAKEKAREEAEALRQLQDSQSAHFVPPTDPTVLLERGAAEGAAAFKPESRILDLREESLPPSKPISLKVPVMLVGAFICLLIIGTLGARRTSEGEPAAGLPGLINRLLGKQDPAAAGSSLEVLQANAQRMRIATAACNEYMLKNKSFPRSPADLVKGGFLSEAEILDSWGRPFVFFPITRNIVSFGEDGIEGTSDDFKMNRLSQLLAQPTSLLEWEMTQNL